jgi:lysozyme
MKVSDKGLALIEKYEGFSAVPYLCPANKWTIGFGNTFYADGHPVASGDAALTKEQARVLMQNVLSVSFEPVLNRLLPETTQNQYDALVSFAYNVGTGNLASSTLLKKLKAGQPCSAEFLRWNKAGGKELAGLTKRRQDEKALFEAP